MIPKEYLIDFDNLRVGDSVWLHGQVETKIIALYPEHFCPIVTYNKDYHANGKYNNKDNWIENNLN